MIDNEELAADLSERTTRVVGRVIKKFCAGIIDELQEQANYISELEAEVERLTKSNNMLASTLQWWAAMTEPDSEDQARIDEALKQHGRDANDNN